MPNPTTEPERQPHDITRVHYRKHKWKKCDEGHPLYIRYPAKERESDALVCLPCAVIIAQQLTIDLDDKDAF